MQNDERRMLRMTQNRQGALRAVFTPLRAKSASPCYIGRELGISPQRIVAICQHWVEEGWYTYEKFVDMGKLAEQGFAVDASEPSQGESSVQP